MTPSEKLEDYYKSGRMLVKLAEALGRLSLAGRELTRLAGYTERVNQLMNVINDLNKGHYERTMIKNNDENNTALANVNTTSNNLKPYEGKIIYKDNIIKYHLNNQYILIS
jgi:ATP-binding cassette subfamily D (ALD) protein 3